MTYPRPQPIPQVDFEDILRRVRETMDKIDRLADRIDADAQRAMRWLGLQLGQLLQKFTELRKRLVEILKQTATYVGDPRLLYGIGQQWAGANYGGVVSGMSGELAIGGPIEVDDFWSTDEGRGAYAYVTMVQAQQPMLENLKATADVIDNALAKVATAIVLLWLAILAAVVHLVLELAAAGIALAAGVTAPAGLGIAVAAIGQCTLIVGGVFAATIQYVGVDAVMAIKDLQQQINDNRKFAGGHWTRSTTLFDIDASGWQPR